MGISPEGAAPRVISPHRTPDISEYLPKLSSQYLGYYIPLLKFMISCLMSFISVCLLTSVSLTIPNFKFVEITLMNHKSFVVYFSKSIPDTVLF